MIIIIIIMTAESVSVVEQEDKRVGRAGQGCRRRTRRVQDQSRSKAGSRHAQRGRSGAGFRSNLLSLISLVMKPVYLDAGWLGVGVELSRAVERLQAIDPTS
jgi:hypothetical protein